MPDLQVLEFLLETFREKEEKLDLVVDCAKTWRFGEEKGKEGTLVWDGEVVEKRWEKKEGGIRPRRGTKCRGSSSGFEVRIVRFVKGKIG